MTPPAPTPGFTEGPLIKVCKTHTKGLRKSQKAHLEPINGDRCLRERFDRKWGDLQGKGHGVENSDDSKCLDKKKKKSQRIRVH